MDDPVVLVDDDSIAKVAMLAMLRRDDVAGVEVQAVSIGPVKADTRVEVELIAAEAPALLEGAGETVPLVTLDVVDAADE